MGFVPFTRLSRYSDSFLEAFSINISVDVKLELYLLLSLLKDGHTNISSLRN